MTQRIHIEANFPVTDDQREHARHINGLETATAEYEAAIEKVTGQEVKIKIYVHRHKVTGFETKTASMAPLLPSKPEVVRPAQNAAE